MKLIMLAIVLLLSLNGCSSISENSPVIDPNTATDIQNIAESANIFLSILSVWWPVLLPFVGYFGGAIRISKKLMPKLIETQTNLQKYHVIASSAVLGIEEFKKEYPHEWENLKLKLSEIKNKLISDDDRLKIENVIRGLRGLSSKA